MNKYWQNYYIDLQPIIDRKSHIEIDESKDITNNNTTRWMFELVD